MTFILKLKQLRLNVKIAFYRLFPLCENKIILWANNFRQYGCSPKYITEYLLEKYPNKYDIVWVFGQVEQIPNEIPDTVRVVRYFSYEYLKELHTAKFIICNMRTGASYFWKKRRGQIYIQTWHSSLRLKKIEGDALEHFSSSYIQQAKDDSARIDLLLSGCSFSSEIFRRAFWYDGEIMEVGTPRCDVLLQSNAKARARAKVYHYFSISENSKLVLYAPTFRSNKEPTFLGMDFCRLKEVLEMDGTNWIIGTRLHPNILSSLDVDNAITMSKYPDMQELLAASELLITDYSSCMFDMAIARKPCVLYVPDIDEYVSKERGLYFDFDELPFPIAKSMGELQHVIQHFVRETYLAKVEEFLNRIGSFEDGNAAKHVCGYINRNFNK